MQSSRIDVVKTELAEILALRKLFLHEMNCQVRYNACHERGWTDSYLLTSGEEVVGYGSIKGQEIAGRDTVFEFYVAPQCRRQASVWFRELLSASEVRYIECQSNDRLLSAMLFEVGDNIRSEVVLFEHHAVTEHRCPGAIVRARREDDRPFEHQVEPIGDYVMELDGTIVATGGFLLHYNEPFADVYMEVAEDQRRKGFGSVLVQEVIKRCLLAGRVPAARCSLTNPASRATLTKAGMRECGFMLRGEVRQWRQATS